MKQFLFVIFLSITSISLYSQSDSDIRNTELQSHFWDNPDSNFVKTEIPQKWINESAVIIAKKTEYIVTKKGFFNNKLKEFYYLHKRIKLLDNNAIKKYSEFSFAENQKQYKGFFSFEKTDYYLGIKVIKPDGVESIVEMDDAIKKEINNRRNKYAINQIAIPNLQIGDIIDYYYCNERIFPQNGFYEFSPQSYILTSDYPVMNQTIHVEVLKYCYLNAKSLNDAPNFENIITNDTDEINVFEISDSNREKTKTEDWVNSYKELPVVKFQAYFTGNRLALDPGYQSFFFPTNKIKSSINTQCLPALTRQLRRNITNPNNYTWHYIFNRTLRYIKKLPDYKELPTEEIAKEAYYFIREFWYQQYGFSRSQIINFYMSSADNISVTATISSVLSRLKRDHDIIYVMPQYYGNEDDLLFLGELITGIKINTDQPLIIYPFDSRFVINDIPTSYKGVNAYDLNISKDVSDVVTRFQTPEEKSTENICDIESSIEFNQNYDSVFVKSKFSLTGEEKIDWDSVLFVNQIIFDDFNEKYREYIFDNTNTLTSTGRTDSIAHVKELKRLYEEQKKTRLTAIKEKIKELWNLDDINFDTLSISNYGRWEENPKLEFEISFAFHKKALSVGSSKILSIGYLAALPQKILEKDRISNIYLPRKKQVNHTLTIKGMNIGRTEGLDQLDMQYDADFFNFKSSHKTNEGEIIIKTNETISEAFIQKEDWQKIVDFYNKMYEFSNLKLKTN